MIYAQAGTAVETTISQAPVGLLGTITWGLLEPSSGVWAVAPSTVGITNPVADVYAVSFTAPSAPDLYLVRWYNGNEVLGSEDLMVTSGPPAVVPSSGQGLVGVADLDARNINYGDSAQAQALIDDASAIARSYVAPVFDGVYRGGGPLDTPPLVVAVVCGMVRRGLTNPTGLSMEVLGDYSYQAGGNAVATLYPTARERRLLRSAARAFAEANGVTIEAWSVGSASLVSDADGLL